MITKTYKSFFRILLLSIISLIALFVLDLSLGDHKLSFYQIIQTLFNPEAHVTNSVVVEARLLRVLTCIIVGVSLAVSGVVMQGITGNDFASPTTLGVESGASLSIVLAIFLLRPSAPQDIEDIHIVMSVVMTPLGIGLAALLGGLIAAIIILLIANNKYSSPSNILLFSIAFNSILGAITMFVSLKMSPRDYSFVEGWLLGRVTNVTWLMLATYLPCIIIILCIVYYRSRHLDTLSLGKHMAISLGEKYRYEQLFFIILSVLLACLSIALAGIISFVGLISPHIARRFVGTEHKKLIPMTAIVGALIVILSDIISMHLIPSVNVPIGVVISILSGIYFLYLIVTVRGEL